MEKIKAGSGAYVAKMSIVKKNWTNYNHYLYKPWVLKDSEYVRFPDYIKKSHGRYMALNYKHLNQQSPN